MPSKLPFISPEIRKLQVPDLPQMHRRAAPEKGGVVIPCTLFTSGNLLISKKSDQPDSAVH